MLHRFVPWRRAVLWNQSRDEDAPSAAPDYESGGSGVRISSGARGGPAGPGSPVHLSCLVGRQVLAKRFDTNHDGALESPHCDLRSVPWLIRWAGVFLPT